MSIFQSGGPERFDHQKRALKAVLRQRGVSALLMDPGTGKTAVAIDYASILALKRGMAKVLVITPLVAVDSWVYQAEKFVAPGVQLWAEALGGSRVRRAEALAARGGKPFLNDMSQGKKRVYRASQEPTALHYRSALAWTATDGLQHAEGTAAMDGEARMILEVLNIDSLSGRGVLKGYKAKTIQDLMLEAIRRFEPDLIVVDESHLIKGASSNTSKLLARIGSRIPRRMMLTGTVMPHSPMDVFAQWRFLEPYAFGHPGEQATAGGFANQFARMGGWMGQQIVGYQNLDQLENIMARNSVVVKKQDALDLPETTDVMVPVSFNASETKHYEDMKKSLAVQLRSGNLTVNNRLTQMLRLRQITCGYLPNSNGTGYDVFGDSKMRGVASVVNDTLATERRIVVFAYFTHEIEQLRKVLQEKGTRLMVITGGTPTKDRIAMRKEFGSDSQERIVMIAQIATMSLAVNELVTASHAVFASLSQKRDEYIQAKDRLDRIGQTLPVTFWHVIVPGTIDEAILHSHQKGTNLESEILQHVLDNPV